MVKVLITLKDDSVEIGEKIYDVYFDGMLKSALDSLVYNASSDWDFVIVVSGDRMVRVGKSVLAQQIAAYLAYRLKTPFSLKNIFFDSQEMINFAQKCPINSVLIFDEAREGLAASKNGKKLQQDLLDYFAECGQLNHIFIIVLPDFFELKENMAVGRSEYMVNVYRKETQIMQDIYNEGVKIPIVRLDRGYFEFFSRDKKRLLFDIASSKHQKNYHLVKSNFIGRFTNTYTVDPAEYKKAKKAALARFEDKKKDDIAPKHRADVIRDKIIMDNVDLGPTEIAKKLYQDYGFSISHSAVSRVIQRCNRLSEPVPDEA
jgi:hypothetical protein